MEFRENKINVCNSETGLLQRERQCVDLAPSKPGFSSESLQPRGVHAPKYFERAVLDAGVDGWRLERLNGHDIKPKPEHNDEPSRLKHNPLRRRVLPAHGQKDDQ